MAKRAKLLSPEEINPTVQVSNYFDPLLDQSWGPRTISDIELILIVQGRYEYVDENDINLTLTEGDVLLIKPEVTHTFKRVDRSGRSTIACIHSEMLPGRQWSQREYRLIPEPWDVTHFSAYSELRELFAATARAFAGRGFFKRNIAEALTRTIWLTLAEVWTQANVATPKISVRMEEMQKFLRERFRDPISRQDLAQRFQVTPQYVNNLFKAELDMTPGEYLNRYRVEQAREMLLDGASVKQAALAVGFCNPFHFSTIFKKVTGMSPSSV